MGTAQDQTIHALVQHRSQIPFQQQTGFPSPGLPGLNEFHQARTFLFQDAYSRGIQFGGTVEEAAGQGALGGQDPHLPTHGLQGGGLDGGFDPDEGKVVIGP